MASKEAFAPAVTPPRWAGVFVSGARLGQRTLSSPSQGLAPATATLKCRRGSPATALSLAIPLDGAAGAMGPPSRSGCAVFCPPRPICLVRPFPFGFSRAVPDVGAAGGGWMSSWAPAAARLRWGSSARLWDCPGAGIFLVRSRCTPRRTTPPPCHGRFPRGVTPRRDGDLLTSVVSMPAAADWPRAFFCARRFWS